MLEDLKKAVCYENKRLVESGLVILTWGNVSGFDDASQLMVIKPSGIEYDRMNPCDMVVVDMDGKIVEGNLRPSSDTPTHIEIYKNFKGVHGIVHTHSVEAVGFAQAVRDIPCYGTTHADLFFGSVPCTRMLSKEEVCEDYEKNTGKVILERFADLDYMCSPGVLVAGHGPFTWGNSPAAAVDSAIALESVARMARITEQLSSCAARLPDYVLEKHYMRKHGRNAYYGQSGQPANH